MDHTFFAYLQRLEILAFFSGYALVYLAVQCVVSLPCIKESFKKHIRLLLPYTYAIAGTLFLGFELNNHFPNFSITQFMERVQDPFLFYWSLLPLACWIPVVRRYPFLSLLHSFVYLLVMIREFVFSDGNAYPNNHFTGNYMRIYSISLLAYLMILLVLGLSSLFYSFRSAKS